MIRTAINGNPSTLPQTVITPSSPAAGANLSYTILTGTGWVLESMTCQLVTSATVANRLLRFRVKRGSNILGYWALGAVTAASQTLNAQFGKAHISNTVSSTSSTAALPTLPPLQTGDVIESFILNIDTTDALTAIVLLFSQQ